MFACWFVCLSVCLPQGGVEQYEGVAESVRTTRWLLIRSPSLFHTSTADRGWVTVWGDQQPPIGTFVKLSNEATARDEKIADG